MKISLVHFPYPSPIAASVRAVEKASLTLADLAQNAADKGATSAATSPYPIETPGVSSAKAAVPHPADKIEDEILDILA